MKRAFLSGVVALCLSYSTFNISAQSMSHEEEVVPNAYAKFSLLCSMPPLTNAAVLQLAEVKIDTVQLDVKVANATPVFDLSDFQTGPIASIASETWGTFVTPPPQQGEVLDGQTETQSYLEDGNNTSWDMANVRWKPSPQLNPDAVNAMLAKTVTEAIKIGSKQWQPANMPPVTYTRYAAFTVSATFQGKSTGPHKAIFFFGTDAKGRESVAGNDLISGTGTNFIVNDPVLTDPSGLLMNKVRETPIIANWIRANTVTESACSQTTQALCCSRGHCGISSTAFNHAMATPLPAPQY